MVAKTISHVKSRVDSHGSLAIVADHLEIGVTLRSGTELLEPIHDTPQQF